MQLASMQVMQPASAHSRFWKKVLDFWKRFLTFKKHHCARWGPSSPPQKGGRAPNFRPISSYVLRPNGCMDQDATWYGGRPRPRPHSARWGPSYPSPNDSWIGEAVFAGLTSVTGRQTHWPTDHTTRSVTIGRIYVRSTAMRRNNYQ